MLKDGCVAYWSALNAYGLTEQFVNKLFIQSSRRGEQRKVEGIGSVFHFIQVKPHKLTGY
jgi:predicted transcriptional regulator of viral defense system